MARKSRKVEESESEEVQDSGSDEHDLPDGSDDLEDLGHGNSGSENEEGEKSENEDSNEGHREGASATAIYTGEEGCTLDLRNLTAVNSHQVNTKALYSIKKGKKGSRKHSSGDEFISIPPTDENIGAVNEEHLFLKAREGCTQILKGLWSLETERTDVGPMALLPKQFEIKTPRALPPPPPKQETKWEKFAKERGIAQNNEKRSRKVWDDETGTWMYRHGYQKANDSSKEWPIMEVKRNEDPFEDPWERSRESKRAGVEKNIQNRMRNMERSGTLPKGTTTRTFKDMKKTREAGREGGKMDVTPSGVPVDMARQQRGKNLTKAALLATQRSTASLGKFDAMREGEPERKKTLSGLKKRKFESATDRKVVKNEADRNSRLLDHVMKGGAVQKAKAIRRGDMAKGETAYDYDYDNGLGASAFKKKKGRAGAGKMRKVTKKRSR